MLELNPNNPAVRRHADCTRRYRSDPRVEVYARPLYEQAVIAEGSKVADPAAFAKRVNDLIARDAAHRTA